MCVIATAVPGVFPAYAGMIPIPYRLTTGSMGVPRIRGDDPVDPLKVVGFI